MILHVFHNFFQNTVLSHAPKMNERQIILLVTIVLLECAAQCEGRKQKDTEKKPEEEKEVKKEINSLKENLKILQNRYKNITGIYHYL